MKTRSTKLIESFDELLGHEPSECLYCLSEEDLMEAQRINAFTTSLKKAREFAEGEFRDAGESLDDVLPEFDKGFTMLKKAGAKAKDTPRIQMPVIEPQDMKAFDAALKAGQVDIFKPYAKGKLSTPRTFKSKDDADAWINLGFEDGKKSDDKVRAKWTSIAVGKLLPTQNQVWLDKIIGNIIRFGKPSKALLSKTVIVSKDMYILDGHHRWGQAMVYDTGMKLRALHIPIDIDELLKIGFTYGIAIGNVPKA